MTGLPPVGSKINFCSVEKGNHRLKGHILLKKNDDETTEPLLSLQYVFFFFFFFFFFLYVSVFLFLFWSVWSHE
jgi:hypothetical protein